MDITLYWSSNNSKKSLEILDIICNNKDLDNCIKKVNLYTVITNGMTYPPYIRGVPSLFIDNDAESSCLEGKNIYSFLDKLLKQIEIDKMAFHPLPVKTTQDGNNIVSEKKSNDEVTTTYKKENAESKFFNDNGSIKTIGYKKENNDSKKELDDYNNFDIKKIIKQK